MVDALGLPGRGLGGRAAPAVGGETAGVHEASVAHCNKGKSMAA